jgi:hypothetical protein
MEHALGTHSHPCDMTMDAWRAEMALMVNGIRERAAGKPAGEHWDRLRAGFLHLWS